MAAPKRNDFERENDYRRITDMYLQGKTQADIASVVGLAQQQVSYDLATIKRRWQESGLINMDEAKQKELARVDNLERVYWAAWERSLDERTKTRTEQSTSGKGDKEGGKSAKATIEKETLLGVPAYLAGVQWCVEQRCKILGLYAPTKLAPTTPEGDKPYVASDEMAVARSLALLKEAQLLSNESRA